MSRLVYLGPVRLGIDGTGEDYTEVRNLARDGRFPAELVRKLERLPGFRNIVIHGYVALDLDRAIEALDELEPVEQFLEIVRAL